MINQEIYEDCFNRAMARRGGRLNNPSTVLENHRLYGQSFVDRHRQHPQMTKPGSMPHVHVDLVDNTKLNATACIFEDKEFIGIHMGTIQILQDLFYRMLARRDTFPNVGNPDTEDEKPETIPGLSCDFSDMLGAYGSNLISDFPMPRDPLRCQYAQVLLTIAISTLVFHELAHLRNGHVQLKMQLCGRSFMMELDSSEETGFSPLVNQVLEWDADRWAATQGAASARENFNSPFFQGFVTPVEGSTYTWGVAVWCLFRLIGGERWDQAATDVTRLAYPPTLFRMWSSIAMFVTTLEGIESVETAQVAASKIVGIVADSEAAIAAVTGNPVDATLRSRLAGDVLKAQSHGKLMVKTWDEQVRPMLLPLTRASQF